MDGGGGRTDVDGWSVDRVLAARYVILIALAVAAAVVAGGRGDWDVFVSAGRDLIHRDGLSFYSRHGDVQTGPVSLLVAAGLGDSGWRDGFVFCVILTGALGVFALRTVEHTATEVAANDNGEKRVGATTLLGGMLVVFWWAKLGGYGHLDDAIVLAAAVGAAGEARRGRSLRAALLVGLAIGVKPWAVIFLPLAVEQVGSIRSRVRPTLLALTVGLLWWAPFVLFAPETVRSMRPTVNIAADSVLTLFGLRGDPPSWLRVVQLAGALAVGLWAMFRTGPAGVVLAAVAFRVGTDPGTWSYYTAGFVVAALAWDLLATRRVVPVASVCASLLLLPSWIVGPASVRAWLRLFACAAALVLVLSTRRGEVAPALVQRSPAFDGEAGLRG